MFIWSSMFIYFDKTSRQYLFGPVRLLGTLEYTISEEKVESCRLCVEFL